LVALERKHFDVYRNANNDVGEYITIDMVGENPKKNQPDFFFLRDHPLAMASISITYKV
jgi:hypothetical protein